MGISFKIAVCGPHGAGKSALVRLIIERLTPPPGEAWMEIMDVARDCPYEVGGESNGRAQRWILDQRREQDARNGLVVSDGCMLNDCAYYLHWAGERPTDLGIAVELARSYDVLVSLPADPRLLIDDGLRPGSREFLNKIQYLQSVLFAELTVPMWQLPAYDRYARTVFVDGPLRALYRQKVLLQRMVALAFVVNEGELLMVRRPFKGTPQADGLWDVVAGTVEFGEAPSDTCVRECMEEMGLRVRMVEQLGPVTSRTWLASGNSQFQALIVAFRCELIGPNAATPCEREVMEWRWASLEELRTLKLVPSLARYVEELQRG